MLETERLILRPPRPEDLEPWTAFSADAVAMRFLGGVQPRAAAWRGFMSFAGSWSMAGFGMFTLVDKASGRWAGRSGPWQPADWPGTEVGWGLAREFWGRGYATEAATAAIDWAFDHLGWIEVIHCIDAENTGSQNVARRLGSTVLRRQHLPAPFETLEVDVWGQSREAWRARRAG
ncbi:MAG TPA: GNAT family N-acetyltransferase [Caulobacteraceae bacterium]|nr:GNAT family N-acetyltransferase [Caulobacteraceae bacterium]